LPKLWHAPKSNILGLLAILPLFLFAAYEGVIYNNYLLVIGSLGVWLLFVLFAINYWFQAFVVLTGAIAAFYYNVWGLGLLLLLLVVYLVGAARFREGKSMLLPDLREKVPFAQPIFDLFQDKNRKRFAIIAILVIVLLIGFFGCRDLIDLSVRFVNRNTS
jgi:hypothetical protein